MDAELLQEMTTQLSTQAELLLLLLQLYSCESS
jgi:hypothetical protein